jgi:hypothetical protein
MSTCDPFACFTSFSSSKSACACCCAGTKVQILTQKALLDLSKDKQEKEISALEQSVATMQAQAGEQEGVLRELEAKNRALADTEVAKQRELAALRAQFATAQVLSLLALPAKEGQILTQVVRAQALSLLAVLVHTYKY